MVNLNQGPRPRSGICRGTKEKIGVQAISGLREVGFPAADERVVRGQLYIGSYHMRAILSLTLALAFSVSTGMAADVDKDKLVGKWTRADAKVKNSTEFTKDGMVITIVDAKGKEIKSESTYTLDGDKLTIKTKDRETVSVITKLTDDELVMETGKTKRKDVLKRVK
jgi:uncharacterized protein (TIGR03066 family)